MTVTGEPAPAEESAANAVKPVMTDSQKVAQLEQKIENQLQFHHCIFLGLTELASIILYSQFTDYGEEVAAGATGATQTISNYYPMFQDVHVMIFIGFGFLMTFMKRYSFSSISYNFFLAALTIQYAILVNGFFHCVFSEHWAKIQLSIVSLITGDFAAGAVLISMGACLGKATLEQLVAMVFFEIIFYAINESIGVEKFKAVDMGGSMFVHAFGAYFGMSVSWMLTKKDKLEKKANNFASSYTSDMFAMIGTVFLWMYWPSFNGALATGASQHRVVVNTVLALTNSCVAAFLMSKLVRPDHKIDMVDIQNATLAGGVAVGSSADLVIGPWSALVIGLVAGSASVMGYVYLTPWLEKKIRLHDTCGVHNLHGIPGLIGGIGGAISAGTASGTSYGEDMGDIFPGMKTDGYTANDQGNMQMSALAVTLCFAIGGGLFTGKVLSFMNPPHEYGEDKEIWGMEFSEDEKEHLPITDKTQV